MTDATKRQKIEEQKAELLRKRAELDQRLAQLQAREKATAQREDARRKIVLGAAVLAFIRKQPQHAAGMAKTLLPLVADRDRELVAAAFQAPPVPPTPPAPVGGSESEGR
jgi:hypothetical protein